jgi:signal peptidase II
MNAGVHARFRAVAIIVGVVLLDRITKLYIRSHFSQVDMVPVISGFFNIVHTENPGAAFGFLAAVNEAWRGLVLMLVPVVVMAIILPLMFRKGQNALVQTGLALIFGGALGNFWDRLTRGTVTDFLQFFFGSYEFPSFNVADSAITIGATLLILDLWLSERTRSKHSSSAAS